MLEFLYNIPKYNDDDIYLKLSNFYEIKFAVSRIFCIFAGRNEKLINILKHHEK